MNELFILALKNLAKRKKRAALTMLGVFIGIASVVALVSLGQGLQKTINDQFEKVGADKIMIQAKELGFGGHDTPGQLTVKELEVISKVHGVVQTAGQLFKSQSVVYNNVQRTAFLIGIPDDPKELQLIDSFNTWETEEGRLLTNKDLGKAVVGYNLANKKLFGKNIRMRDKLEMGNKTFTVVGILKRTGDPGMDASVSVSIQEARELMGDYEHYSYIVAQSAKNENPDDVAERIKKTLRKYRHQKEGREDFVSQSSTELIESFMIVLTLVQVVFVGIAAISLIVGGIGIMNTMYTAVLERTREIGVMKAIGARNSDVLTLFVIESGLLGFFGGIIGVIVGAAISKSVELIANSAVGPGTIYAYFPTYLIAGAIAFSTVVGMISGVLPARRASRLKPVEALREE